MKAYSILMRVTVLGVCVLKGGGALAEDEMPALRGSAAPATCTATACEDYAKLPPVAKAGTQLTTCLPHDAVFQCCAAKIRAGYEMQQKIIQMGQGLRTQQASADVAAGAAVQGAAGGTSFKSGANGLQAARTHAQSAKAQFVNCQRESDQLNADVETLAGSACANSVVVSASTITEFLREIDHPINEDSFVSATLSGSPTAPTTNRSKRGQYCALMLTQANMDIEKYDTSIADLEKGAGTEPQKNGVDAKHGKGATIAKYAGVGVGGALLGTAIGSAMGGKKDDKKNDTASTSTTPTCGTGMSLVDNVCKSTLINGVAQTGAGGPTNDSATELVTTGSSSGMKVSDPAPTAASPTSALASGATSGDAQSAVGRGTSAGGAVSVAADGRGLASTGRAPATGGGTLSSSGLSSASYGGYGGGDLSNQNGAPPMDAGSQRLERVSSACTTTAKVGGKMQKINCLNFPGLKECQAMPVACRTTATRRASALSATKY